MAILNLTDKTFDKEVLDATQPVLVDFWAPWCGPCQMVASVLDEVSKEYHQRLKICKINVDENQTMLAKFQILSVPSLLFFKNGKVVSQLVGGRSGRDIKKAVDSLIGC